MATQDIYGKTSDANYLKLVTPLEKGFAVTPGDGDLPNVTREIWVGGAGDLVIQLKDGTELTITGVPAGTRLPYRAAKILGSTTATNIVGLY
jgi:hypothetical protein